MKRLVSGQVAIIGHSYITRLSNLINNPREGRFTRDLGLTGVGVRLYDMIREMSEETWMALLQTARRTASYSYDIETRKAQAVLDECCDEDDHHDFIKEISELAPETFNIHERLRLSFLHLCLLDPEQSPSDVTLPEPLLSVSPSLKSTSKMENILFWTCLLLLVYRTDVCKADTAHKPKEVLVIGGGISGLAAARKLVNHPSQMFDVTVLEARKERYGGRVWTNRKLFKKPLGAETDLGAVWINSKVKDNPILAITRKGELETKVSGPIQLHVPEADKIFKGDEANKIFTEVFSIMQSAVDKVKATGVDIPLQKAVEDEISGHSFQGDRAIITSILRNHNAVSKPDYSTVHFDPVKQFGWNTIVVDGYDQVLDAIVSGLGSELPLSISLNQIVRQIKIDSKKKKVIVRTKDLNQVSADLVIVAVPVGVLRSEAVLFEPVLPKEWYKAVKELGVYDSQKVIVGFSEAFWPSDAGVFTMTTPEGEEPFIQTWFNMQNLIDRPFLVGSLYDGAAINLEQTPIEELKELVIKTLGKLFGGEDLVRQYNLTTIVRSQWTGDPFSMGSGAYPRTGNGEDLWETLSSPVCPYIYFAGDYTSLDGMVGAHGSYNTGIRAAEQILNGRCERELKRQQKRKEEKEKTEDKKDKKDEL
ncbi:uncharacterized protein [Argopecten irradians]|uniref:uncharacterized protein isoform X3 n=2 Tax=Argopecten irradians TaxID=31199 RepID=UPI00371AF264